uniref:Uncharacterized protein n=1 Tax=Aegilops tauschii subsp. strangulata TaxID=200361 RepID=A0A453E821_AEGTS
AKEFSCTKSFLHACKPSCDLIRRCVDGSVTILIHRLIIFVVKVCFNPVCSILLYENAHM